MIKYPTWFLKTILIIVPKKGEKMDWDDYWHISQKDALERAVGWFIDHTGCGIEASELFAQKEKKGALSGQVVRIIHQNGKSPGYIEDYGKCHYSPNWETEP